MSTHKLLPWFHLCLGNIHSQYKIIKVKEKITSSFLGLPLAGAQMKPEFETRVRSQEQSASLLILLSCLKLGSIKKILDLFSFFVRVLLSVIKLLLNLLFDKAMDTQPLKGLSRPHLCPFQFWTFSVCFPWHLLYSSSNNGMQYSNAPFSSKILSPRKLPVHTPCASTRQGTRISCWAACFLGSSNLLPFCYFPGCDYPFCRSEPFLLPWVCIQQIK